MHERRQAEIALLRKRYKQVDHGPSYDWVLVRDVPLAGWNRATTDVLFTFPPGFPETPPDNFHVPAGLRLANGAQPGAFSPNGTALNGATWDTFSWHIDGAWTPAARIEDGSNLLDFVREAERRLSEAS